MYRVPQLNLIPEIEVLYMLFYRSISIFSISQTAYGNTSIFGVESTCSWTTLYSARAQDDPQEMERN